jgi:nucleotide-binding universal stress UspA family protein
MLKLLLVPLDGSMFAEQALPHAIVLAHRAQAKVQLVIVRPTQPGSFDRDEEEEKYLARIATRVEAELPGVIGYRVLPGGFWPLPDSPALAKAVADVLSQYASEHDVSLFVMATHGRGGVHRAWLGSVADSVIRIAPCPVLLIRPKEETFGSATNADRGIRHIVIPLDGSETAEQVIPYALKIGTLFSARYSLVRVVSPLVWGSHEAPVTLGPPPPSRQIAADYVERVARGLRDQGAEVSAHVIEDAGPGPAIVQYASTHKADAIALSTAGAGRVRRVLLGSVSDKVVRSSDVPVLVCNIHRLEQVTDLVREPV